MNETRVDTVDLHETASPRSVNHNLTHHYDVTLLNLLLCVLGDHRCYFTWEIELTPIFVLPQFYWIVTHPLFVVSNLMCIVKNQSQTL